MKAHIPPREPGVFSFINFQQRFIIYALPFTHAPKKPLEVNLICQLCVCVCDRVCSCNLSLFHTAYISLTVTALVFFPPLLKAQILFIHVLLCCVFFMWSRVMFLLLGFPSPFVATARRVFPSGINKVSSDLIDRCLLSVSN